MYRDVKMTITDEILKEDLIQHLMGKVKHWPSIIFNSIVWNHLGRYMRKLAGNWFTNMVKYVNNWQNNELYGKEEELNFPVGCGSLEHHLYIIICIALVMEHNQRIMKDTFKSAHKQWGL